jgi:hypothetical protein
MAHQMSFVYKRRDVIFYGVSVCAGCLGDVADRDMTAFAAEFKNLYRQLWRTPEQDSFACDLFLETQPLFG